MTAIDYKTEFGVIEPKAPFPNISFFDKDDKRKNIQDFKGKILIINFWAIWCEPCIKEIPQLNLLSQIIGNDRLEIITISVDDSTNIKKILKFFKKNRITNLEPYYDKYGLAYQKTKISNIPTTFIIDKELNAHYKISGYVNWSYIAVISLINNLL